MEATRADCCSEHEELGSVQSDAGEVSSELRRQMVVAVESALNLPEVQEVVVSAIRDMVAQACETHIRSAEQREEALMARMDDLAATMGSMLDLLRSASPSPAGSLCVSLPQSCSDIQLEADATTISLPRGRFLSADSDREHSPTPSVATAPESPTVHTATSPSLTVYYRRGHTDDHLEVELERRKASSETLNPPSPRESHRPRTAPRRTGHRMLSLPRGRHITMDDIARAGNDAILSQAGLVPESGDSEIVGYTKTAWGTCSRGGSSHSRVPSKLRSHRVGTEEGASSPLPSTPRCPSTPARPGGRNIISSRVRQLFQR